MSASANVACCGPASELYVNSWIMQDAGYYMPSPVFGRIWSSSYIYENEPAGTQRSLTQSLVYGTSKYEIAVPSNTRVQIDARVVAGSIVLNDPSVGGRVAESGVGKSMQRSYGSGDKSMAVKVRAGVGTVVINVHNNDGALLDDGAVPLPPHSPLR